MTNDNSFQAATMVKLSCYLLCKIAQRVQGTGHHV